jgi:hypothetical protein
MYTVKMYILLNYLITLVHSYLITPLDSLNYNFFDPALVGSDDFVKELEKYCFSHQAVNHHFLQNLAGAAFGEGETLDLLVRFFTVYSGFSGGFVPNLVKLHGLLDKDEHKLIIEENMKEEGGSYDEETLSELESMGISRESVVGIPHHQLFSQMIDSLEQKIKCSYRSFVPASIDKMKEDLQKDIVANGKRGLLSWLYFGSELIVPKLYNLLLQGLKNSCTITNEDVRFLILHIDMDHDHAERIREIVIDCCNTKDERISMVHNVDRVLNARVRFYETFLDICDFHESGLSDVKEFYNQQAETTSPGKHLKDICDYACNSTVFDMCAQNIKGSTVIDVGCGDGRISRHLKSMGAKKLIGIDVSDKMIESAKSCYLKTPEEYYIVGDALDLRNTLVAHSTQTNLMVRLN